jgi:hypothetical protein
MTTLTPITFCRVLDSKHVLNNEDSKLVKGAFKQSSFPVSSLFPNPKDAAENNNSNNYGYDSSDINDTGNTADNDYQPSDPEYPISLFECKKQLLLSMKDHNKYSTYDGNDQNREAREELFDLLHQIEVIEGYLSVGQVFVAQGELISLAIKWDKVSFHSRL